MNVNIDEPIPKKKMLDDTNFQSALQTFEITGEYTPLIRNFVKSLISIKPTSTEVERTFSGAGWILNDRRCSMNIELLNAIIVVNKFYKS